MGFDFNSIDTFDSSSLFWQDLVEVHQAEDPPAVKHIAHVLSFSGRGSVLGEWVDHPHVADPEDGVDRMNHSIKVADQINALKANKPIESLQDSDRVTPIIYFGRQKHNQHLERALEHNIIQYPKHLFTILAIPQDNTIGQIYALNDFYNTLDKQGKRPVVDAIVSSAYHLPRIGRIIGCDSEHTIGAIKQVNFVMYGSDRQYTRPGIQEDLRAEVQAMERYSTGESPRISRELSKNILINTNKVTAKFPNCAPVQNQTYLPAASQNVRKRRNAEQLAQEEAAKFTASTLTRRARC